MQIHLSWSWNHTVVRDGDDDGTNNRAQMVWERSERGHIHQSPQPKPQQRWGEVQFTTSMGQHHQEASQGRQAVEGWGGGWTSSSPSRTTSPITSPGRFNWWSWQMSAKALVTQTFLSWVLSVQGTLYIYCSKHASISIQIWMYSLNTLYEMWN